jgi:hypothetical protein
MPVAVRGARGQSDRNIYLSAPQLAAPLQRSASRSFNSCETSDSRPRHGLHEVMVMSNPWLKKNPFMSMWLSGANSLANAARSQMAGHMKRQSTAALNKASRDIFNFWTGQLITPVKPARRKKR